MISCVVFEISPELKQALWQYRPADQVCYDIIESLITDKDRGVEELYAHTQMVSDWVEEDWFKGQALAIALDDSDAYEIFYPACCDDELIKPLVEQILQVYRLMKLG